MLSAVVCLTPSSQNRKKAYLTNNFWFMFIMTSIIVSDLSIDKLHFKTSDIEYETESSTSTLVLEVK